MSLKITFRANREELERVKEAVPSAVSHGGVCEVRIEAEHPAEAAEKARALLEKLRTAA